MLKKLLMGSKKQYKLFIIPKITQVNVNEYEILSDIYPKNDHYLNISSMKTSVSGSGISFADHVVTGSAMEKVVFTRLDSGKTLEISTVASEQGYEGLVKVGSELELFLQKSDVGKTIEITIEPGGGLIGFFRRFVTFLRGGLRNAKQSIPSISIGKSLPNGRYSILDGNIRFVVRTNTDRWLVFKNQYQSTKYRQLNYFRFFNEIFWINRNYCFEYNKRRELSKNYGTKIGYYESGRANVSKIGKGFNLFRSFGRIFYETRRRKIYQSIDTCRIASSALSAGGCHA